MVDGRFQSPISHILFAISDPRVKGLAFHCERSVLLRLEGVIDPMVIGVVGLITRLFCKVYKGCKVFRAMVLKGVLGEVGKLENAKKTQFIKTQ